MVGAAMDGPYYMDAVITPHRSLSRRGFIVLISVLTLINIATAAVFVAIGAGLVPVFLGLDVIALAVALIASNRSGQGRERVQVTAAEVRVVLETRRGARRVSGRIRCSTATISARWSTARWSPSTRPSRAPPRSATTSR